MVREDQQNSVFVVSSVCLVCILVLGDFASQVVGSDQASDPKQRSDPPFPGLGSDSVT